jgi:Serine-threonine protein kinase 19
MPLYLTASHSSRVCKPGAKPPPLRKSLSSPLASFPRRKPTQRTKSVHDDNSVLWDAGEEKLNDTGKLVSLVRISPVGGVLQSITHSQETMFGDIPERAGMNSTRIAEILNFRKGLPPIISIAHVHGLITASTRTEREIASLIASGHTRRLTVSGRGNEVSGLGDFLIPTRNLEACIRDSPLDSYVAGGQDRFLPFLALIQPQTNFLGSFAISHAPPRCW